MKKYIFTILAACCYLSADAQEYNFSVGQATYTELSGADDLTTEDWTSFDSTLNMPFHFSYFNDTVTDVVVRGSGLTFGPFGLGQVTPVDLLAENRHDTDLVSFVSYLLDGSAPNRIMKFQYKNIGVTHPLGTFRDNYLNYQIWMYESDYTVEFRYGDCYIDPSNSDTLSIQAGITDYDGELGYFLYDNPDSPSIDPDPFSTMELTGLPESGTVYRFEAENTNISVRELEQAEIFLYPNPINTGFTIRSSVGITSAKVYDVSGKQIFEDDFSGSDEIQIKSADWPSGVYVMEVFTPTGRQMFKLLR